jgi:hypothetical protein
MTRTLHGIDANTRNNMRNLHNGSLLRMLQSPDYRKQHVAAVICRYMLNQDSPPIRAVIEAGMLPGLLRLLAATNPPIQHEAAWAVCNIAAGSANDTYNLIEAGALPPLIALLHLPTTIISYKLNVVAAQAIGNIAHDHRDVVLHHHVLPRLLELLSHCITTRHTYLIIGELIRVLSSAICRLCQGTPRPALHLVCRALPALVLLLQATDDVVLSNTCWALESFVAPLRGELDPPHSIIAALHAGALCPRLVELSVSANQDISVPALKALLHASKDNLDAVVALGLLPRLAHSLDAPFAPRILALRILRRIGAQDVQLVLDAGLMHALFAMTRTNVDPIVFFFIAEAVYDTARVADGEQTHALVDAGCLQAILLLLHYCTYPRFQTHAQHISNFGLHALELVLRHGQPLDGQPTNTFADELLRLDAATHVEFYTTDQPQHIADRAVLLSSLYLHPMPPPVLEAVVDQSYDGLPLFTPLVAHATLV